MSKGGLAVRRLVNQGWLFGALLCVVLAVFWAVEKHWPLAGIWLLGMVVVTIGMGHGALDALLLVGQFRPHARALWAGVMYLAVTIGAGCLFSLSFPVALIALLLMSAWHFGEDYQSTLIGRIAVGGASVMAPALLQGELVGELLQSVTRHECTWLMDLWTGLAWAWVMVVITMVWRTFGAARGNAAFSRHRADATAPAYVEILLVVGLNIVLTPIFQFALFFGAYHCVRHIARVQQAARLHEGLPLRRAAWAWGISMALVLILMALLWRWLRNSGFEAIEVNAQALHWLVVVLAAVTVPHLVLVSYSQRWLDHGCPLAGH